jgi:hypothetical protein
VQPATRRGLRSRPRGGTGRDKPEVCERCPCQFVPTSLLRHQDIVASKIQQRYLNRLFPVWHVFSLTYIAVRNSRMESSPLATLPPKLIFRILDFMEPHEYSGLSCTCRRALALTNQMLHNPEYMEGVYSSLVNWKSCTALFVNMRGLRHPPATVIEGWMMCGHPEFLLMGQDDPDL